MSSWNLAAAAMFHSYSRCAMHDWKHFMSTRCRGQICIGTPVQSHARLWYLILNFQALLCAGGCGVNGGGQASAVPTNHPDNPGAAHYISCPSSCPQSGSVLQGRLCSLASACSLLALYLPRHSEEASMSMTTAELWTVDFRKPRAAFKFLRPSCHALGLCINEHWADLYGAADSPNLPGL